MQNTQTHDMTIPRQTLTKKWSFKVIQGQVIYFGASEKPLSDYRPISQYNNCGLVYESSEDIARERSERRHFQRPHDDPSPANSHEYTHEPYLARNYDSWATFLPLIVWIQIFVVDSEHIV